VTAVHRTLPYGSDLIIVRRSGRHCHAARMPCSFHPGARLV
jgi:hypothetical protein